MVAGNILNRDSALLLGVRMMQPARNMARPRHWPSEPAAVHGRFDMAFMLLAIPECRHEQPRYERDLPEVRADPRPEGITKPFERVQQIVDGREEHRAETSSRLCRHGQRSLYAGASRPSEDAAPPSHGARSSPPSTDHHAPPAAPHACPSR